MGLREDEVGSNKKSEWRRSKKRQEYHKSLRERGTASEQRIFEIIAESGSLGISTKELSRKAGLHRDSVYTHCKELTSKELIQKNGKFGKYHITSKAISDTRIGGFLFGREATRQVLREFVGISGFGSGIKNIKNLQPREWISASSKYCNNRFSKKVLSSKPKKDQTISEMLTDKDGLTLFEFSLRTGALITFIFMKGMKYRESGNAMTWIRNAIMLQSLLKAFETIEPVAVRLESYARQGEHQEAQPYESGEYGMQPNYLRSLEAAYERVFPKMYRKLEYIWTNITPPGTEKRRTT